MKGGSGYGGGLYDTGNARVVNTTVISNTAAGGTGGRGGSGGPAFAGAGDLTFGGDGGQGGQGGSGFGGIYAANNGCLLSNCTIAFNAGLPGNGGQGGEGGLGTARSGWPGAPGLAGSAGGGLNGEMTVLQNSLLVTNLPGNSSTASILDAGCNLSTDGSIALTNRGSLGDLDVRVGVLADHGGPTWTVELLPGSPAIDKVSGEGSCVVDQRGYPRPAGTAADIGAFEFSSVMPTLSVSLRDAFTVEMLGRGNAGQTCRLESAELGPWTPIATNRFSAEGTVIFEEQILQGSPGRSFRLVMP
jgi:hypothetical protein